VKNLSAEYTLDMNMCMDQINMLSPGIGSYECTPAMTDYNTGSFGTKADVKQDN